ncbi:hypothetical protein KY331_02870 [Candidatus Woesearchaeota archaeon]|nr:hypothetical protein [Candidatus Woesearchaeota archaeon]
MAIDLYLAIVTLGIFIGTYLHSFHKAMPEEHHVIKKAIMSHLVLFVLLFLVFMIK